MNITNISVTLPIYRKIPTGSISTEAYLTHFDQSGSGIIQGTFATSLEISKKKRVLKIPKLK